MHVHHSAMTRLAHALAFAAMLGLAAPTRVDAQPQYASDSPAPVVTGFVGLATSSDSGHGSLSPTISPIVLAPIGQHLLFEGEVELAGSYQSESGAPWSNQWDKGVEYAQIDWFIAKQLTLVGGRFLTPFGIFNERLHSGWIRNLPDEPLVAALEMTDSNGAMVRGGLGLARRVDLNYAAFVSAPSARVGFVSSKAAGGRASLFLSNARVEIGGSFQRQLEDKLNQYGADVTWQSSALPLDVRAEVVRNPMRGAGYWAEGAYRLRRVPFATALMRRSQVAFRVEQFFAPSAAPDVLVEGMDAGADTGVADVAAVMDTGLPGADTRRFTAGWNYWITPDVRASLSYGRALSSEGTHNVWTVGLTYRFTAPLAGRNQ